MKYSWCWKSLRRQICHFPLNLFSSYLYICPFTDKTFPSEISAHILKPKHWLIRRRSTITVGITAALDILSFMLLYMLTQRDIYDHIVFWELFLLSSSKFQAPQGAWSSPKEDHIFQHNKCTRSIMSFRYGRGSVRTCKWLFRNLPSYQFLVVAVLGLEGCTKASP